MADFLTRLVRARANILVAGETGAGKTTFLRTVTDLFDPTERIGVVEDTAELALENPDRFSLETLHPHDLAAGEADTRLLDVGDLVANALRMRPDRLIVGEIRLPKEAFYTLQALHTGHDGSATTIHASSAEDALFRLELLARQSMRDLTVTDLRTYIARVFDLVVVLRRLRSGRRIVRQLTAVDGITDDGGYRLTDVFRAEADRGLGRDPVRRRDRVDAVAAPARAPRARGRAMELIGAIAAGVAVLALILALAPARAQPATSLRDRVAAIQAARVGRARTLLEQARLDVAPRTYLALAIVAPLVLGFVGLVLSAPMAVLGLVVGALVPRWYVRYLVVVRGPGGRGRRAAGPAGDGQPRGLGRHVPRPLRRGRRGRPPPLGEGRLRGDPLAATTPPRRPADALSRCAAARRAGTSRSSTTR